MGGHLVLLGDSVFDNRAYVLPGERSVIDHLAAQLAPVQWTAELRAVDGSTTADIPEQIEKAPLSSKTVLVLSVGGNDAILRADLLGDTSGKLSLPEALVVFREVRETFRANYRGCLERVLALRRPLIVCTIYNPRFEDPTYNELAETALSFFNDVITEEALARDLPVLDLRRVCAEDAAFANPIEPSDYGGQLIAEAIVARITSRS